jgi:hypothetical protein
MHIGISGSRHGFATRSQEQRFKEFSSHFELFETDGGLPVLHHGDCTGIDEQVFYFLKGWGWRTVGHPPIESKHRAYLESDETKEPREYMTRNMQIVRDIDYLIAIPSGKEDERRRSGTWATVRMARRARRLIKVILP